MFWKLLNWGCGFSVVAQILHKKINKILSLNNLWFVDVNQNVCFIVLWMSVPTQILNDFVPFVKDKAAFPGFLIESPYPERARSLAMSSFFWEHTYWQHATMSRYSKTYIKVHHYLETNVIMHWSKPNYQRKKICPKCG